MADAPHDDHVDVIGIGVTGQNLGRVAHDHVASLRWDAVALGQVIEDLALCIEQGLGVARGEERGSVVEAEFIGAD
ncbi:hypothetical protein D3C84_1149050 [compost metagenome]